MTAMPAAPRSSLAMVVAVIAIVAGLALAACTAEPDHDDRQSAGQPAGADGRTLVGYLPQWRISTGEYRVKDVQVSGAAGKLTHLLYAFGAVKHGTCTSGDSYGDHQRRYRAADSVDGVADSADEPLRGNFGQLRALKRLNPRLKVLWSFGGWRDSAGFTEAARDPVAFAASCRRLVRDSRWADVFDGIDIDWEYPNSCGRSCDRSGPDALRQMTSSLRSAFGTTAMVTAAISGDGGNGHLDATDYAGAAQELDWVMVMTYDYAIAGTRGPTAPHSALTSDPAMAESTGAADAAIRKLKAMGVPGRKLLLGVGFYGRGWSGVSQAKPGGSASGAAPGPTERGLENYRTLVRRCPPTGTVGGTAYAICNGQWWSYDTATTITAKMAYVRAEALGGSFVWELSGDTTTGELLAAARTGLG